MYVVRWCDHEGNWQELQFKTIMGAKTEAAALDMVYDGVEIIGPDGERIWPVGQDGITKT